MSRTNTPALKQNNSEINFTIPYRPRGPGQRNVLPNRDWEQRNAPSYNHYAMTE